jgi:hypothetical protein
VHALGLTAAATLAGAAALAGREIALRREAPTAAPCDAPLDTGGRLRAGGTDTVRLCWGRGARARLRLQGDGGADLDCYLYAPPPTRELVARDDGDSSGCALDWRSAARATYSLEVVNLGPASTLYRMWSE